MIKIVGNINIIDQTPINSHIHICKSAVVKNIVNSTIENIFDSAVVNNIYGSSEIKYIYGSVVIGDVYDSVKIKCVYGLAIVKRIRNSAVIENVCGAAVIKNVYDSANIKNIQNSATIECVYGSAIIERIDNLATIKYVAMNAIVKVASKEVKILEARQQIVIIYQGCEGKPKKYDKTITIKYITKAVFDLINFVNIYKVKKIKNKLILYKFVQSDYTDFYTGKIKYEVGKVVKCPDWNSNINNECGGGLHLSSSINNCKKFHESEDGHALKCEVDIKDILIHPNPLYPEKVRCREVKVLEEIIE